LYESPFWVHDLYCRFYRDLYPWASLAKIIYSACGIGAEKSELQTIAANVSNIVRDFNLREGMQPKDEKLPPAFHRPLADTGSVITEEELDRMLKEYYHLRGWE